jgi:hypothetical protein
MQVETARAIQRITLLGLLSLLFGGQAGCRSPSPAPKTAPVPTNAVGNVISYWDSPLHPSDPPSSHAATQQFQAIYKKFRPMLYSRRPFHEVELPIFVQEGFPLVKALWSGREIICKVDIGTGTIMWPQWLHLDTQQLHISRTQTWPRGGTTRSEWMLTPRIEVGGMVLIGVPTEAVGLPRPRPSEPLTESIAYPLLGMQAFSSFVTTIDYQGKKLLLRDSDYDVTRQPQSAHSRLIPYKGDAYGRVVLPGTLGGHKATFSLDTGSEGIYVTSSFAQKHLSFVPDQAILENGVSPALPKLSVTVSGLSLQAQNVRVMQRATGPDVLLGAPFFLRYRVTIDRYRSVVLVEENR